MDETFSAPVLEALKDELKILVRLGIGYDKVDTAYAAKLGICLLYTSYSLWGKAAHHRTDCGRAVRRGLVGCAQRILCWHRGYRMFGHHP